MTYKILVFTVSLLWAAIAMAQTFNKLADFDGTNGDLPYVMSLIQGTDGNLYGTTQLGGANASGTIFKVTADGQITTLHSFVLQPPYSPVRGYVHGAQPFSGLLQTADGNFYGTTHVGGRYNYGTVYRITPDGTLTTLYSFCSLENCADGWHPHANLIQAYDGNLYGSTKHGGASNWGTIFKITLQGALTTLYNFSFTDGANPSGALLFANGNFYGTAYSGGVYGDGTVFSITPNGTLTTLHSFSGSDGSTPYSGLVHGTDGNFYGTTTVGGANGDGTVFSITPDGTLTTLHSFEGSDGSEPFSGLIQASDGNFYGTTAKKATIFSITSQGTLTTLHAFDGTDGAVAYGGLFQALDGNLYGTTGAGGAYGDGTIFTLSLP